MARAFILRIGEWKGKQYKGTSASGTFIFVIGMCRLWVILYEVVGTKGCKHSKMLHGVAPRMLQTGSRSEGRECEALYGTVSEFYM
jgi:hypothetical protein